MQSFSENAFPTSISYNVLLPAYTGLRQYLSISDSKNFPKPSMYLLSGRIKDFHDKIM